MTTIGEANGKSSTFTINSYPDRLCGPPVVSPVDPLRISVFLRVMFVVSNKLFLLSESIP